MQVLVIGAADPMGLALIRQGLDAEMKMNVIAPQQDVSQFRHINDPNFKMVPQLTASSDAGLTQALTGCHAVVTSHGLGKDRLDSRALTLLTAAMKRCQVKRLLVLAHSKNRGGGCRKYLSCCHSASSFSIQDGLEHTCEDLDWTLVHPPKLLDTAALSGSCFAQEGRGMSKSPAKISVVNVAEFLIEQLSEDTWYRKSIYLMPPKQAISI